MRSPQGGLNTGKGKLKVLMCPVVGESSPTAGMGCLPGPGQQRGLLPSSVCTKHRAVRQGYPRDSVGTTYRGIRREGRQVRVGKAGRSRALGGERPMGTAACRGKGFKERTRVSGEGPMGTTRFRPQSAEVSC